MGKDWKEKSLPLNMVRVHCGECGESFYVRKGKRSRKDLEIHSIRCMGDMV